MAWHNFRTDPTGWPSAVERCLHWLFHAESAGLEIGAGYDAVPKDLRPIILGWVRFPKTGGMTVQTTSAERAIAAARFFGPRGLALKCSPCGCAW
jgi:hypothetical protein